MRMALRLAEDAARKGDVPIGAVVARGGEVLGGRRQRARAARRPDRPRGGARPAAGTGRLGGWRLPETTIYVTLEPCAMCAGAITLARVPRLVYGAADPKGGAVGSVIDLFGAPVVNHRPSVESGLLGEESADMLEDFFSSRR